MSSQHVPCLQYSCSQNCSSRPLYTVGHWHTEVQVTALSAILRPGRVVNAGPRSVCSPGIMGQTSVEQCVTKSDLCIILYLVKQPKYLLFRSLTYSNTQVTTLSQMSLIERPCTSLSYINWSLLAVKNKIKNLRYTFSLANNFSSFFLLIFCSE